MSKTYNVWITNTKKNETEFIYYLFHIVASFIEKKGIL